MPSVITKAFEEWSASQVAINLPARPDTFIFAYIPGLDPDAPVNRNEALPSPGQIVHSAPVIQFGVLNNNAVVYSVVLDTTVGNFDYNWIGLQDAASGTLCMIVHTRAQKKIATSGQNQGNTLTRTFAMEFNGAAGISQITVTAATWQIDFSARLAGMDEQLRLCNLDKYGHSAFIDAGFLVTGIPGNYWVTAGTGYVGGVRAGLLSATRLVAPVFPSVIWLDISWQGQVTSRWETSIAIAPGINLTDYTDSDGFRHFVAAIASLDSEGNITDLRPRGSLAEQQANNDFLRKDQNLNDLGNKTTARNNLDVYSKYQADGRYPNRANNLNDLEDAAAALAVLGGVKKSGDTMTGNLSAPNIIASAGGKLSIDTRLEISAGAGGEAIIKGILSGHSIAWGGDGNFNLTDAGAYHEQGVRVYSPGNKPTEAGLGANWWWRDNATGLIRQGGFINDGSREGFLTVGFPIAFPVAAIGFSFTPYQPPNTSNMNISVSSHTEINMNIYHGLNESVFIWEAVGY